jgi:hypothetical protein
VCDDRRRTKPRPFPHAGARVACASGSRGSG